MSTAAAAPGWSALDRRTVAVAALTMAGVAVAAGVPAGIGIADRSSVGAALLWVFPAAVLLTAGGTAAEYVRWRRTRYRVGDDRVELRSGLVLRKHRSLHRERIRSVDVTANPLIRMFGLVSVQLGTGEQAEAGKSSLRLNPVSRAEGERLRALLHRHGAAASAPSSGALASLDPRWIAYAPISVTTPILGAAAFGAVFQVAQWFGAQQGVIGWSVDLLRGFGLVGAILALVAVGFVVGVLGSLGLFVEMWWRYRLDREPGGTLRVRRGLLTVRSISLEEKRLRGIDLVEPLGNRLADAGRIDAVATGMVQRKESERTDHKTLLPAAPRALTDRVAAGILHEESAPTAAVHLAAHPTAARARRLRWAAMSVVTVAAPLAISGATLDLRALLHLAWIAALVQTPIAVWLAVDAYRNLGHGITGGYLVTRSGAVRRSTVALQRRGVIGWTAKQSIFQRRTGLITLTATTAAGAGGYSIRDVGEPDGLAFAEAAVPDLFGPFLERA